MAKFIGRHDSLLLFSDGDKSVIVDSEVSLVVSSGYSNVLRGTHSWAAGEYNEGQEELATAALLALDTSITASASKLYTIPKGVQLEAKQAMSWYVKHGRGASDVGLHTARTLAHGGQVDARKIRHIAKFFPQHTESYENAGWFSVDDAFPSNSRISWALWGGDAARKWTSAIVDRENSTAMTADGFGMSDYTYDTPLEAPNVEDFKKDESVAPEFIARVRMDGTGIDRLYKIDLDSRTYVWDNGSWDDLGDSENTIWTYDHELDGASDPIEKTHVVIDPDSAIVVAARIFKDPGHRVTIDEIDEDEARMAAEAASDIDWAVVDYAITAGIDPNDGVYTPDERAANAGRQVRDKGGKFATVGSRVMVNGDASATGNITRVNPADGTVAVQLEDGTSVTVPGKAVEGVSEAATTIPGKQVEVPQVDTSGILGEPRTPINRKGATLPGTLPAMDRKSLHSLLGDWPAWVKGERDSFKPLRESAPVGVNVKNSLDKGKSGRGLEKNAGAEMTVDAYQHPLLQDWLRRTNPANNVPNSAWYNPLTAAVSDSEPAQKLSPDTSDVQPVYLAVVAPDDPRAVLHLVSLVPVSTDSTAPMTYVREEGKWVRDADMLSDLNSATPPPIVPLDTDTLNDVLKQVDEAQGMTASGISLDLALMVLWGPSAKSITAAGKAGRGAAKLRKYWTRGRGAAKIRWGTGGDWTRCVRHLSKYLGPRAKGYCALRHHEMTGMWTGDKRHVQAMGQLGASTDYINTIDRVTELSQMNARANEARARMSAMIAGAGAPLSEMSGAKFRIPLVIPEEVETGDGRVFEEGAITLRDLPLPLLWQFKTAAGHDGSVVVGRIDFMERIDGGIGNATGVFDNGEQGREAERLVRGGFVRWVSADMDKFEAEEEAADEASLTTKKGPKTIKKERMTIKKSRVMAVTMVPKPAFQECIIILDEDDSTEENGMALEGAEIISINSLEEAALVACGVVASAIPVVPPTDWFSDPKLRTATPMSIDDDGRVFGHIAAWHVDHIGMSFGTKPPRSASKYAHFHHGVVRTDSGKDIPVGQLTLAGGHAGLEASAEEAVRHYDDTKSAIADVHAGEDSYGIWVAGALRPGTTPAQIRALRASAPSGDWRPVRGSRGLELVAICQVNVPGFPIARARVASGQVMALVAAGAAPLARLKISASAETAARVAKLSEFSLEELSSESVALKARFTDAKVDRNSQLASRAEALSQRFSTSRGAVFVPREERLAAARTESLTAGGLRARIEAVSISVLLAAGAPDPVSVNDVGEDMSPIIPTGDAEGEIDVVMKGGKAPRANGAAPTPSYSGKYTAETQPRDRSGKFRLVLAQLRDNIGVNGNQQILDKIQATENLDNTGDYGASVEAASDLISTIDRLDSGALNAESIGNVRKATSELGSVIANLPLPFGEDNDKLRFSDLPPALQQLAKNLVNKVEDKLEGDDAQKATKELKGFMSGASYFSQSDISSQMNVMLRLLT